MHTPQLRPDKPISQLMMTGAAAVKPTRGAFLRSKQTQEMGRLEVYAACAIGAAAVAAAGSLDNETVSRELNKIEAHLGSIALTKDQIPPITKLDSMRHVAALDVILILMDTNRWSIKRIATWLKSIGH